MAKDNEIASLRSEATERETRHSLEVPAIPRQQDPVVDQYDAGDQAVPHADAHTVALQAAPDLSRPIGRRLGERQARQGAAR